MMQITVPDVANYTPDRVWNLYDQIRHAYASVMAAPEKRLRYCPPQGSIVIRTWGEVEQDAQVPDAVDARASIFASGWPGKCVGQTIVCVDENTHERSAISTVYDEYMHLLGIVDAGRLVELRTALLATMAIEALLPSIDATCMVGLIGPGPVNIWSAWVMNEFFGVKAFVWRGSPQERDRNLAEVRRRVPKADFVVDRDTPANLLNYCDVLISCTTNGRLENTVTYQEASKASVYVGLDLGWCLHPSIREHATCYADYLELLAKSPARYFPWDNPQPAFRPLYEAEPLRAGQQAFVAMIGFSLLDLIVAYDALGLS